MCCVVLCKVGYGQDGLEINDVMRKVTIFQWDGDGDGDGDDDDDDDDYLTDIILSSAVAAL